MKKNLLADKSALMYDGALVSDLMTLSAPGMKKDAFSVKAQALTPDGHKIVIENYDSMLRALNTPAKKLLNTAIIYLAASNGHKQKSVNPSVEIPFLEYAEACGIRTEPRRMESSEDQAAEDRKTAFRLKHLKKDIRRDLQDISSILWTATETKGANKGDYIEMRVISSHSIKKGMIRINFDVQAAAYLAKSYLISHPLALLKVDNRNPNAYVLGYKIAQRSSFSGNAERSWQNALSVEKLLASAPEIQSYEELRAKGQRNWKEKIKRPLEGALDELIRAGVIESWIYKESGTDGEKLSRDDAETLSFLQFVHLIVSFDLAPDPSKKE